MQVNQSALVGEYVADHICGFICYLVRHVTLGNMLFSFITCNAAIWNSYGYISVFWNILQFSRLRVVNIDSDWPLASVVKKLLC